MKELLKTISSLNIIILRPVIYDVYDTLEISDKEKLDFDDALVISCMRNNNIKELVSYDKHFDKVKDIKRVEP